MSQLINLNIFAVGHESVIDWISQQLGKLDLVVKPSFDLQTAKSAHTDCACPHHGTSQCDCQIVVLLVYHQDHAPVSLLVHSQDGITQLSMMAISGVAGDDTLAGKVFAALRYQNIQTT
jgi:hypothetical protein